MPRARNRYERVRQALAWLQNEWPCGRPLDLRWVDEIVDDDGVADPDAVGQTYRVGAGLVIELRWVRCPACLLRTLFHEYAHAAMWPVGGIEDRTPHHPPGFWSFLGEIQDRWDHDNGWEEAREYEVE